MGWLTISNPNFTLYPLWQSLLFLVPPFPSSIRKGPNSLLILIALRLAAVSCFLPATAPPSVSWVLGLPNFWRQENQEECGLPGCVRSKDPPGKINEVPCPSLYVFFSFLPLRKWNSINKFPSCSLQFCWCLLILVVGGRWEVCGDWLYILSGQLNHGIQLWKSPLTFYFALCICRIWPFSSWNLVRNIVRSLYWVDRKGFKCMKLMFSSVICVHIYVCIYMSVIMKMRES